ncbi:hypothetical protein L218DRAFT_1008034 [Marasmius fiardii PR-910]|nr:hypothetical protein L218DRAFT_1008034 [Marasmius fiardii PR-910]
MIRLLAQAQETIHALSIKQLTMDVATPPTEPTAPAFIVDLAPECKSLFAAFPRLEANVILDVICHDLIPTDLHKLDLKLWRKAMDQGTIHTLTSWSSSSKDYPSLSTLLHSFGLYFLILTHFAASGGHIDMLLCYEWDAVLAYHAEQCHEMKQNTYTGWGKLNDQLFSEFLTGHLKPSKFNPASSSK